MLGAERAVQANLEHAHPLAPGVQIIDHFFQHFAGRAHSHHHAVGFGIAVVVEGLVRAAGDGGHPLHGVDHDGGQLIVEGVGPFAVLEIDVRVLGGTALVRVFRVHGPLAEFLHAVPVYDALDVFIIDDFDFAHFVRGAEAVEEVTERQTGINGRQMGHQAQVHGFLGRVGTQEGKAGLAGARDVLMIAEDGQGVSGHGARGHMEHAGQKLARDLVHVGDHEQEALRGGEGGGQRAAHQKTVDRARGPGFGLHFADGRHLAHQVFFALSRPFVGQLTHDGRRGDGIDGGRVAHGVGDIRRGRVAVPGFHVFCHVSSLLGLTASAVKPMASA